MELQIPLNPHTNPGKLFFVEIDKLIPKFNWTCKEPRTAKTILKKENKVGGLTPPRLV